MRLCSCRPLAGLACDLPRARSIRIRYQTGYAKRDEDGEPVLDNAGKVEAAAPPTLKHAALLLLAHLYEYRAAAVPVGSAVTLPLGFETLVQPFRVWS